MSIESLVVELISFKVFCCLACHNHGPEQHSISRINYANGDTLLLVKGRAACIIYDIKFDYEASGPVVSLGSGSIMPKRHVSESCKVP